MNDPIVDEVRRIRDAHSARFNYDLDAIFRDLKEQERKSGRKFVSFVAGNTESPGIPLPTGTVIASSSEASPIDVGPASGR